MASFKETSSFLELPKNRFITAVGRLSGVTFFSGGREMPVSMTAEIQLPAGYTLRALEEEDFHRGKY